MLNNKDELQKVLEVLGKFDMTIAPIEPTDEMINETLNVLTNKDLNAEDIKNIYASMLLAFQNVMNE